MDTEQYASAVPSATEPRPSCCWQARTISLILVALVAIGYYAAFSPPRDFPTRSIVSIARGASAPEVVAQLSDARIIAHPRLLRVFLRVSGQSAHIQAGMYLFDRPEDMLIIVHRLVTGAYGLPPVRITFPEGETVREMAERVVALFSDISASEFLSAARPHEGYLFPDTYHFEPWNDTESIIVAMRANFDAKIAPLADKIERSGRTRGEMIILASLVEKEARSSEVRRMVAGILWNRFALDMPLQVDAVFGYIFNRDTYSPSFEDLKVDSPYNTYLHTGLPPGPINNPSLDAIEAVLNPTTTDFLYYLTDTEGKMHYATTYAEHQANQKRYLRRY